MRGKWLTLSFLTMLVCGLAQASRPAGDGVLPLRDPGEGLWRPAQIQVPEQVRRALTSVVRIRARSMRFRLSLFDTPDAAGAGRKVPHAQDKEFTDDGSIVWPVLLARPQLEKTCSVTRTALSPGLYELCRGLKASTCTTYPCAMMTEAVASSAGGVAVSRLADGMIAILTAYHVVRESIERNHRTAGQYTIAPIGIKELDLEHSSDPLQAPGTYHTVKDVYLLANASEKDWQEGKDWALLGVPSLEATGLAIVPVASKPPKEGDPIWVLGFPFRTQRSTASILGYSDANGDFRVSYGLAVGAEDQGAHPPYVLTNADIVSGNSGGPLINSEGEVVAIVHNSLCKPDGEIDLSTVKLCGIAMGTSVDALGDVLLNLKPQAGPLK